MFFGRPKSLNHENRPDGITPHILLLHYTGMETMQAAKDRLSNPESKVSAHYLIDTNGDIFDLVPEDKRAWHAGISYWDHAVDINSVSIGVELVNRGHEFGYHAFPGAQMQSLVELCKGVMSRNEITHVLGHSDVAPERKTDPGELFDWEWLAKNHDIGIWANPSKTELEQAQAIARNDYEVEKLFVEFGYNPMAAYIDIVTAFHRHFYPERFETGDEGQVCVQSVARLLSLIRQSHIAKLI